MSHSPEVGATQAIWGNTERPTLQNQNDLGIFGNLYSFNSGYFERHVAKYELKLSDLLVISGHQKRKADGNFKIVLVFIEDIRRRVAATTQEERIIAALLRYINLLDKISLNDALCRTERNQQKDSLERIWDEIMQITDQSNEIYSSIIMAYCNCRSSCVLSLARTFWYICLLFCVALSSQALWKFC
jgi:hypothetical protein